MLTDLFVSKYSLECVWVLAPTTEGHFDNSQPRGFIKKHPMRRLERHNKKTVPQ